MREGVALLNRQRVHVGAKPDRLLAGLAALQGADHAGGRQAAMDLDTPRGQLVGHDLRRARLLEGGLGMAMNIAADGRQLGRQAGEAVGGDV